MLEELVTDHPHTARYTTPDPLGLAPAPNPHTYAQNPTTTIDLFGLAPIAACGARNVPGIATGPSDRRLRGSEGNAARIPGQVADALRGRAFSTFDSFREEFWRNVRSFPELRSQFSLQNQIRMDGGYSPFALDTQWYNGSKVYTLHHIDPVRSGGGIYDMDNLAVVTSRFHGDALDPTYRYKR
ncbi:HNH endonuclease signature motif containing protein [Mycobacterium camsae]|uniref:HNH endonuclease signature motif containing protein n=1 Tax=Mycobacterium gordonae TaxID=1778 RepID=UPI00197CE267|nr:HNH endonuclease [Mycobacterium gordonae]